MAVDLARRTCSGSQTRTSRPAPSGRLLGGGRRRARRRSSPRPAGRGTSSTTSCSRASSQGTYVASPTSSRSTRSPPGPRRTAAGPAGSAPSAAATGSRPSSTTSVRQAGALGGVRADGVRGHQHAPLPTHPVLRRDGPVGVEHVALVEDRVGHGAGRRSSDVMGRLRPGSPSSSRSSTSSQPSSPCRPRYSASRSWVARRHPQPGLLGEVRVHRLAPDRDRQPGDGLLVPRHRLDRDRARARR